jgi:MFS family permease
MLRLIGLGLSAMLVPLGSTMIAVALPGIGADFHRAPSELTQWLVNSYLVVSLLALGPGGKLGDRWGCRKALHAGQLIFGAGCLVAILWPSFATLVASRVMMALGGALMVPTVMALFRITVAPERVHRIFGYFGAMMGFAAAIGPSLGGLLVHHFGWMSIFVVNLPPLLLSVFFSRGFFRNHGSGHRTSPLVLGWRARVKLFDNRSFAAGCAMVGLLNLGMYTLLFELPYLLQLLYQWGADRSGTYMTGFMVSMMAGSALGGRVAEIIGPRGACLAGSLCSAAGFGVLSLLSPSSSGDLQAISALVLAGAGLGLANGPSQSAALVTIDRAASGVASGIIATCRYIGGVVGITMLTLLLAAPGAANSSSQHLRVVLILAGSLVLAALVSLLLPGRTYDSP